MKQGKIVSVDFDGVVIEKVFYRDWVDQSKKSKGLSIKKILIYTADIIWTCLNQMWRKPVTGAIEGLWKLKKDGYFPIMMTSRKAYLGGLTKNWLKKWGGLGCYEEFYFNHRYIGGADSKVLNIKDAKSNTHIDDNLGTILILAEAYPAMKLLWLSTESKEVLPPNVFQCKNWGEILDKIEN